MNIDRLANEIANVLMTNGYHEVADRLVLRSDSSKYTDLGGWCRQAVVDNVSRVLRDFGMDKL